MGEEYLKGQMTAAVLYGKEDIKIEKVPIPTLDTGEVLVKVNVALTCGTDLKVYQRGYHARMIVPPALFGHELSGVIEEVGPGVRDFRRGMKVVALNSAPCGSCFYCLKHQENICEDLLFNNGAYAEYIKIPRRIVETNMLALPDDVSFESAAMTEPLACALRGLQETGADIGDTVTIHDKACQTFVYKITGRWDLAPDRVTQLSPSTGYDLTLVTCDPWWQDYNRLVWRASLVQPAAGG